MEKNLYEILEISKNASSSEIKKAYAKLLRKFPPEKFSKEFSIINSAYETLNNEEKRYEYDQLNGYDYNSQKLLDEGLELIEKGEFIKGRKYLESFVSKEGEVTCAMQEIAKSYALEGKYGKAYDIQKNILEKEKFINFEEIDCMIHYLYKLGDEDGVQSYMKKAILKFKDVKTYYNLMNLYIEDKKIEEAKLLLVKKIIPFIRKQKNIDDYCICGKLLLKVGENEKFVEVISDGIYIEWRNDSELEEKLEKVKNLIVEILNFKNAKYIERILEIQINYINKEREKMKKNIYMDNLGWTTLTKTIVGDMSSISKVDMNKVLKRFLLVSVKKRIAIDIQTRDYMGDKIIEYLEEMKNGYDMKKIKDNLLLLERFHESLYKIDAKYLFDRYGGFIPYSRQVKENKRKKKKEKKGSGSAVFVLLGIVIVIALIYFI
ncbi:MAG: J domain-containing protein [Clostridium sp.]|uniref:J domain-containing protein n=1 Tax=Clostridium sp. TaxID=1506 RepID=UPI003F393B2B